jgi:hypothetical protein
MTPSVPEALPVDEHRSAAWTTAQQSVLDLVRRHFGEVTDVTPASQPRPMRRPDDLTWWAYNDRAAWRVTP